jgi:hypothetical protein
LLGGMGIVIAYRNKRIWYMFDIMDSIRYKIDYLIIITFEYKGDVIFYYEGYSCGYDINIVIIRYNLNICNWYIYTAYSF